MFAGLQRLGKTIFLTTHYMEEAQRLADRVAIIVDGTIIAVGAPETLSGDGARATTVCFRLTSHRASLPEGIDRMAVKEGDRVTVRTGEPVRLLRDLTGWALDRHVELEDLSVTRPSLEDVYLQLTSEAERPTHE
jgi:ABC-2 type transport system ATP-binding protein